MDNALFLAAVLGPMYLVMGLSLLMYPKVWRQLLDYFSKDHFRFLGLMVFNLVFGLVIINMYNVWAWDVYLLVTISGWGAFLKGVFYFLAPGSWTKEMVKTFHSSALMGLGGLVTVAMGAALSYYSYLA